MDTVARAATSFASSNQGLSQAQELSQLLDSGKVDVKTALAAEKFPALNAALSPIDQRFNSLRVALNSAVANVKGDPSISSDTIDSLSKRLPTYGDSSDEIKSKISDLQSHFTTLKQSLDPDGHIERALAQRQAAPAQPAPPSMLPPGVAPAQWQQIQQMRMAKMQQGAQQQQGQAPQQAPQQPMLQPGDRMD